MHKPWLSQYAGIPENIDLTRFNSIPEMFDAAFARYPNRIMASNMDKSLTYAQVDNDSKHVAAWLQSLGLQKGDRVAIMMPNCLQYMILVAGILRAGLCVTNVNPLYTPDELTHQLKDSGSKAIFILENFAHNLEVSLPHLPDLKHVVVSSLGEMLGFKGKIVNFVLRHVKKMVPAWKIDSAIPFAQVMGTGAKLTAKPVALNLSDLAFLQYTGGTTGISKGATLTHGNIVANVLQAELWCAPAIANITEGAVFVAALPLYHIFGLTVNALFAAHIGGHVLLITNPRDIPAFIKDLKKYPFAVLPAVNTLFVALLNNPEFKQIDFSHLRVALGGGMAVQKAVADQFQEVTGVPICEAYGLSETSPAALINPVTLTSFTGYTGLPISSTEVAILDDAGQEVPYGESGEVCIRGPQVMPGYWQRPDETAKVMTADGFFRSGDIGVMNEQGYVKIIDRKKDMVLVSGFNVYPNEVEDVAVMYPKVLECAVIGVPDDYSGEAVKLFVVKKDESLTAEELQSFLKEHLTGYKRPKYIEFRSELPKSNVGKILRRELREK